MIGIGGGIAILILTLIGIIVFVVLMNREPIQNTVYDYSPRSIVKLLPGKDWKQANCEINLDGEWIYNNPNNSDVSYVNGKTGGVFGKTYPIDFDPKDTITFEGKQGKLILAGISNLKEIKFDDYEILKDRVEYLENLLADYKVKVNDLSMQQEKVEDKNIDKARKRVIIPQYKPKTTR